MRFLDADVSTPSWKGVVVLAGVTLIASWVFTGLWSLTALPEPKGALALSWGAAFLGGVMAEAGIGFSRSPRAFWTVIGVIGLVAMVLGRAP